MRALNRLEASSTGCSRARQIDGELQQQLLELTVQARSIMEHSLSDLVEHGDAEGRNRTGLIN